MSGLGPIASPMTSSTKAKKASARADFIVHTESRDKDCRENAFKWLNVYCVRVEYFASSALCPL